VLNVVYTSSRSSSVWMFFWWSHKRLNQWRCIDFIFSTKVCLSTHVWYEWALRSWTAITLKDLSMMLLKLDKELLVLLYLEFVVTMLIADSNIETCCLDSVFAANSRSSLSYIALWHWNRSQRFAVMSLREWALIWLRMSWMRLCWNYISQSLRWWNESRCDFIKNHTYIWERKS